MADNACVPKSEAKGCDGPLEQFSNDSMFLLNLCNDYFSPVTTGLMGINYVHRNIFCLFCKRVRFLELSKVAETDCYGDENFKLYDEDITGLLDYKDTDSKSMQHTLSKGGYQILTKEGCTCREVYDSKKVGITVLQERHSGVLLKYSEGAVMVQWGIFEVQ